MYQPKIKEELIPQLYRLAKARGVPMTRLVSDLLESALKHLEQGVETVNDSPAEEYSRDPEPSGKGGEP